MIDTIRKSVDRELRNYTDEIARELPLKSIDPLIHDGIKEFVLRPGKRVRPCLFVMSYLCYSKRPARGLYRSAVALELLHDFLLIHDDIIDRSDTRRGRPAMHVFLQTHIDHKGKAKFSGEDLAIVLGDVVYAMAIRAFMSIAENGARKERALGRLIESVIYTGSGEFAELMAGLKSIEEVSVDDIVRIYDLKTGIYTFASPMSVGAALAGASVSSVDRLYKCGIALGRAFQIKDDIIGLFNPESEIGKPNLTDLQEAKKTLLVWSAYKNSNARQRSRIKQILSKTKVTGSDLDSMRKMVVGSGALDHARSLVEKYLRQAVSLMSECGMSPVYRKEMTCFCHDLLSL